MIILDQEPLSEDKKILESSQNYYIKKFNEISKIMASMPDIYEAGKSSNHNLIESLRKDFEESGIISSTRIDYKKSSLEGTITHYFGSSVVKPIEKKLIIPIYEGEYLDNVLKDRQGLIYLQSLFNTDDGAKKIEDTLNKLSNLHILSTRLWTCNELTREEIPPPKDKSSYDWGKGPVESVGGFQYDYFGLFEISTSWDPDGKGRARSVSIK